ncbi:MAG: flagellar biosynthesis anti-sigma factor FlgM [Phycisphaerales bacterium]|nr:flagellar biosynthesis anti-sigma factor FlgM [Phycisphaerales bacterium]
MSDIAPISTGSSRMPDHPPGIAEVRQVPGRADAVARPSDRVELSDRARFLSRLAEPLPIRQDLVDRARAQIDAGTYETDERISGALDALREDLDLSA